MKSLEQKFYEWSEGPKKEERKYIISTHEQIRKDIEIGLKNINLPKYNNIEIYLQGSYANNTNISHNSDVDIVVQYNSNNYSIIYNDIKNFKTYIFDILRKKYLNKLKYGNKCLKVENFYKIDADILPSIKYLHNNIQEMRLIDERESKVIINYPKIHKENCSEKNQNTNENFKKTIRIFKNIKQELINLGRMSKKLAPSYYIENLLYNVPNNYFNEYKLTIRVENIIAWIDASLNLQYFTCANKIDKLLSQDKWNRENATNFLSIIKLYINNNK